MQEYNSEICKNHCQIVGQKKKEKKKSGMTWLLTWCNLSTSVLNAMLQFLVII